MVRMQDLLKSFSDLQKEEEKPKISPPPQPPSPPPAPPPPQKEETSFSNLDAIKKAIQENLGASASRLLSNTPAAPTEPKTATPLPVEPPVKSAPAISRPTPPPTATPTLPKTTPTYAPPPTGSTIFPPSASTPAPTQPPIAKTTTPEPVPASELETIQSSEEALATQLYVDLHRTIAQVVQSIKEKKPIDPRPLVDYIPRITEAVKKEEYLFLKAIQRKRYASWLISHSVNIAIFAIKVGIGLKYDREKLTRLGLAALLHDVGMTAVPNSIIFKHGKLTPDEYEIVKEHPLHGYELLKHLKNEYPYLPEVALQEQEREDGSGYPQGLTGENIHEFAKIIGIVDVFEALVHGRAYREGFITYYAIQKIIEQRAKQFNVKYVRALINSVTMFPVGSLVKLSTEEIARVISVNSLRPMRPVVEVLTDASGVKLRAPIRLNLEEEPLIYIVKPIEEA